MAIGSVEMGSICVAVELPGVLVLVREGCPGVVFVWVVDVEPEPAAAGWPVVPDEGMTGFSAFDVLDAFGVVALGLAEQPALAANNRLPATLAADGGGYRCA